MFNDFLVFKYALSVTPWSGFMWTFSSFKQIIRCVLEIGQNVTFCAEVQCVFCIHGIMQDCSISSLLAVAITSFLLSHFDMHVWKKLQSFNITEICAELLLTRWAPNFDYNSPAGNFWVVAGSNDPWRCVLASPSMGSCINSAGVLPHFAEDDPSLEALEGDRTVRQWIT